MFQHRINFHDESTHRRQQSTQLFLNIFSVRRTRPMHVNLWHSQFRPRNRSQFLLI